MDSALHVGHATTTMQRRAVHSTRRMTPPARPCWQFAHASVARRSVSTSDKSMATEESRPRASLSSDQIA